jgi:glycerophosphoryl diester phosphodiesterase
MYFIAHRGYSDNFEDNSVQSINAAINHCFDMIEIDVQYTKDNILVLHHDVYCAKVNKMVYEMNEYEAVNNGILTLEQFFQLLTLRNAKCTQIYLDLKSTPKTANILVEFLKDKQEWYHRLYIGSFHIDMLHILKDADFPNLKLGLSLSSHIPYITNNETIMNTIDFVSFDWNIIDKTTITSLKLKKKEVFLFTCHNICEYKHILKTVEIRQIDGIFTNIVLKKTHI